MASCTISSIPLLALQRYNVDGKCKGCNYHHNALAVAAIFLLEVSPLPARRDLEGWPTSPDGFVSAVGGWQRVYRKRGKNVDMYMVRNWMSMSVCELYVCARACVRVCVHRMRLRMER